MTLVFGNMNYLWIFESVSQTLTSIFVDFNNAKLGNFKTFQTKIPAVI